MGTEAQYPMGMGASIFSFIYFIFIFFVVLGIEFRTLTCQAFALLQSYSPSLLLGILGKYSVAESYPSSSLGDSRQMVIELHLQPLRKDKLSNCSPGWTPSGTGQTGLQLTRGSLPQLPECWQYRPET